MPFLYSIYLYRYNHIDNIISIWLKSYRNFNDAIGGFSLFIFHYMKKPLFLLLSLVLLNGCIFDSEEKTNTVLTEQLTVKFSNTGSFPITALYFKPIADTATWGNSYLTVAKIDSMEYVWVNGLTRGVTYAFKTVHDSSGHSLNLTFTSMFTGGPDTISAFAYLNPNGSFGHGYNWGLSFYEGESLAVN